jgi:hypothetical protein
MSYEHRSNSQRLWNYGYFKFKKIWTLHRTSGSFMHLRASEIQWCTVVPLFCLLRVHASCFSCNPLHGNVGEWGQGTAVINSVDDHVQSISQGTVHSGTASCVDWNVGCPIMLEVPYICNWGLPSNNAVWHFSCETSSWLLPSIFCCTALFQGQLQICCMVKISLCYCHS